MLHEDGVDVAFEMIDADEGFREGEGEGLGVGDADEEGAGETGAAGDGDGVEVLEGEAGFGDGGAGDGDDVAEVFARGELGDDAAEVGVEGDLAGDDVGEGFGAVADDGGCGLVAGALDAQDEAEAGAGSCGGLGHLYSLGEVWAGERVAAECAVPCGARDRGQAARGGACGLLCGRVCAGHAAGPRGEGLRCGDERDAG